MAFMAASPYLPARNSLHRELQAPVDLDDLDQVTGTDRAETLGEDTLPEPSDELATGAHLACRGQQGDRGY